MGEHSHACRSGSGGTFNLPGAEASYAPDLALEPVHQEIHLRFDLDARRAEGGVTTTVRGNRPGERTLRLEAIALDDLTVESPDNLDWRYDGEGLRLTWDKPFEAGEERRVTVRYSVTDPVSGMRFSTPDEAYPDRAYFMITDHETERARHWLPCVDFPTVRTTFDFHLTAAADLTILANGILLEEEQSGDGTKTAHWTLDFPCPSYLCCIAIGRFTRFEDESVGGRPVAYFASEHRSAELLRRSFGRTPEMMRWLEGRLGVPFPFKKYYQVALPEVGGAMENISLVTWDEVFLADEAMAPEWCDYIDSVNIHEMAHSYFGDAVVCRHFEHSWLKESWATYVETVWLEEKRSVDEAHYDLHLNALRYFDEVGSKYARPIVTRTYNSSWDLFDAHLYPGGAWRIHMLRNRIGDEAFWTATRDYLESYSGKFVETEDFRRKLEEHSGLNLVRFFDQWIYGRGYPKLKASFSHDAEKDQGTLVVQQTQKDEKKEIGLFAFPLEVAYTDDEGAHQVTLEIEGERTTTILPVKGKPTQIRFDPGSKALFSLEFSPGADLLKNALREAPDIRSRIHAAKELIKTGTRPNLEAVRDAMRNEPFWGVRAAVARELGEAKVAAVIEPLATLLGEEGEPRVKRALALACSKMRDSRLRDALLAFLEGGQPPWARGQALDALGSQQDESDFGLLAEATAEEGLHHLAACGALRGLGGLRSVRAFDLLEERLAYGVAAEPTRPATIDAFARSASLLERERRERAVDRLADLTRDGSERIRLRAAIGLGILGMGRAIPALEALKRAMPAQEEPRIERIVAHLRKGAPGEEERKLREQVEKLEEKCRKLDERLQDLEAAREKAP